MLPLEAVTLLGQRATPLEEPGEADRLGLVGVDQPPIGTGEPVEPCPDLPLGRVRALRFRTGAGGGGFYREVRIPNLPKGLHLGGASWPGPTASSTSTSDAPSSASSRPAPPWARSPPGSGDPPPPSTASWAGTASATATAAFAATSP